MASHGEGRLPLGSLDLVDERMAQLKRLFPEACVEGRIDFDRLRATLGDLDAIDTGRERYRLEWAGKVDAIRAIQTQSHGTLRPCPDQSINFDQTGHIFIEGENLEALKLLQKSYWNGIKMIYIDPPYNTGKEFIYPDNYRDSLRDYLRYSGQVSGEGAAQSTNRETDGRYHSKWLTMIYPRLFLARNLLREDGVIFISIDDNEVANLRKVCDEIFGEENFLNCFTWVNNLKGRQISTTGASKTYEYILCYGKNIEQAPAFHISIDRAQSLMSSVYKMKPYALHEDNRGKYVIKNELHNTNSHFNEQTSPTLIFDIYYDPVSKAVKCSPLSDAVVYDGYVKIPPKVNNDGVHKYHAWRWSREKIVRDRDDLHFEPTGNGYKIYTKIRNYDVTRLKDIITDIGRDNSLKILGIDHFENPKPIRLLKLLGSLLLQGDDIILDFFAGSCTTAHAVLDLNREDGGARRFIMVQLPEPCNPQSEAAEAGYTTIADIGTERIRRVIRNSEDGGAGQDMGFRVFRLSDSNFKVWEAASAPTDERELARQIRLFAENLKPDRSRQDLLYELLLKEGLPLTAPVERRRIEGASVYVATGGLLLCLETAVSEALLQGIIGLKPKQVICLDNAFAGNDQLKTNTLLSMKAHAIAFRTV